MSLRLDQIWIHPVKSFGGMRVARAEVDDRGLVGDRRFMVVDERGLFLTQREHVRMAEVKARIEGDRIVMSAPAREPISISRDAPGEPREVTVWADRVSAIDCGDAAARWIEEAIGLSARLVRMPESTRRAVDPRYAREGDLVSFADGFPFLLVTDGSIAAVNARQADRIDARRFRPNLVVSGASAFAEDEWRELRIGPIRFYPVKRCSRCAIVNVDPDRAVRGVEPLATLATFRAEGNRVFFGQNLVHDGRGTIREGDEVVVV